MAQYAAKTEVGVGRRRTEIERTLERYGATSFAYGWDHSTAVIMFEMADRRVRFKLPLPKRTEFMFTEKGNGRTEAAQQNAYEQAVRQRWAALALAIKAKLECVEAGIESFEQAFLAHIIVPGTNVTMGEWATPQLEQAYQQGDMPALLPGTGGADDG